MVLKLGLAFGASDMAQCHLVDRHQILEKPAASIFKNRVQNLSTVKT
jgi:hypothetical protein